jgi:tRNA (guanine-N7-)-methyltransferase
MSNQAKPVRTVRSYVRREGRITRAQQRALAQLWHEYGIDDEPVVLDFARVFARERPVEMEIGFGDGEVLCELAQRHRDTNYLGIDVYRPGIGSLLLQLQRQQITNVRVICADATLVVTERVPASSLDAVYLLFPDPWPKKRHHKRRLLQQTFLDQLRERLRPGGCLHIATDWQAYAEHILTHAAQVPGLTRIVADGSRGPRPDERPRTRFERRGQRLGHPTWELLFQRTA